MRILFICTLVLATLTLGAGTALAKPGSIESGFLVFKETRAAGQLEIRDAYTGRVISSEFGARKHSGHGDECHDSRHRFSGPRWRGFEPYYVNMDSLVGIEADPAGNELDAGEVFQDLIDGHLAWQQPLAASDCEGTPPFAYQVLFGGQTGEPGSLVDLETDGHNVVEFRSLAGTICDGALACTILFFQGATVVEADMIFEKDLTRYGFEDYWTTGDRTFLDPITNQYQFAVIDVSTHEFGHWAGLDHVLKSPSLTMYPYIHDGMQTLGLGDLKGIGARYQ